MQLLMLGGSVFLGRAYVEEALRRGHDVTTFNRGQTQPDVVGVEVLQGDRADAKSLAPLRGRRWDAVIDTSGFVPRYVGESARAVRDAGRYAFVSTVGASASWPATAADENAPRFDCPPDGGPDDGDYGTLKAGCERAVEAVFGDRALIIRPGVILGPHENTGRLPYWLERIARGGRVLAPGDPATEMQLVDARDIAIFTLDLIEKGSGEGIYNVVGPPGNATFGSWLGECLDVTGSAAELVWVADHFLVDHSVEPWTELPLWLPMDGESDYAWQSPVARAEAAGLTCRPVGETAADTWAWMQGGGKVVQRPDRPRHVIDDIKEASIIAGWFARG